MLSRLFRRRFPAYMGGLLLSLGAMLALMTAKKAFAPKFHEVKVSLPADEIRPEGRVKIIYDADPGLFLPPGFPSQVNVWHKGPKDTFRYGQLGYRELTEKEPTIQVAPPEYRGSDVVGDRISVTGELYICAGPGVADCTKFVFERLLAVKQSAAAADSLIQVDLAALAQKGLEAGASAKRP